MMNLFKSHPQEIVVHCIPVARTRDQNEKASQPFQLKTVSVPRLDEFVEMSFGHTNKETGKGEIRRHTYKVIRVSWKESGAELLMMEEPMLMRVL